MKWHPIIKCILSQVDTSRKLVTHMVGSIYSSLKIEGTEYDIERFEAFAVMYLMHLFFWDAVQTETLQ
jgi:hypothetical protein